MKWRSEVVEQGSLTSDGVVSTVEPPRRQWGREVNSRILEGLETSGEFEHGIIIWCLTKLVFDESSW